MSTPLLRTGVPNCLVENRLEGFQPETLLGCPSSVFSMAPGQESGLNITLLFRQQENMGLWLICHNITHHLLEEPFK